MGIPCKIPDGTMTFHTYSKDGTRTESEDEDGTTCDLLEEEELDSTKPGCFAEFRQNGIRIEFRFGTRDEMDNIFAYNVERLMLVGSKVRIWDSSEPRTIDFS